MGPKPTLITGGAGFVGRALAAALLERGKLVRTFDRCMHSELEPHARLQHVVGDVTDPDAVGEVMQGCKSVLHLAAVSGVGPCLSEPERVLDTNIFGTRTVLRAATEEGIPVVFGSSSEAYGRKEGSLAPESPTHLGPTRDRRWCDAVSKLAGEHYAWAMRERGLRVAVVRYFNVYGPQTDGLERASLFGSFLERLRANEPLPLVEGGHATRSFCYIDDAVVGTLVVHFALMQGPADGGVYNIGREEPVTIRRLAQLLVALSAHRAGMTEVSSAACFGASLDEASVRVPDLEALRELGFEAETSLEEGLRKTLMQEHLLARPPWPIPE